MARDCNGRGLCGALGVLEGRTDGLGRDVGTQGSDVAEKVWFGPWTAETPAGLPRPEPVQRPGAGGGPPECSQWSGGDCPERAGVWGQESRGGQEGDGGQEGEGQEGAREGRGLGGQEGDGGLVGTLCAKQSCGFWGEGLGRDRHTCRART